MLLNDTLTFTPTVFKRTLKLIGNRFEISVMADEEDEGWANNCIDAAIDEIQRTEQLLTAFGDTSQINLINSNAGVKPVKVHKEIFTLIQRSVKIAEFTQGAFDISHGAIHKRLWGFKRSLKALTDKKFIKRTGRLINYSNIILDKENSTVFLKDKRMRIGFSNIVKGYAVERAKYILKQNGVENGSINAGGDLTAWGYQPGEKPWTIGAIHPNNTPSLFSYLNITDKTVTTLYKYEKLVVINGKNYSHTVNPRTGMPVRGIKSVTIIGSNATIAAALSVSIFATGINAGLDMINQLKNMACIIIDEQDKIHTSKNINLP